MSDSKLPSVQAKQELAREHDEVGRRLAEMRCELAQNEERVIPYVCAVTGGRFIARFKRRSPEGRFRITGIEKDLSVRASPGVLGRLFRKDAPARSYPVREFNYSGWECPYCSAKGHVLNCHRCGEHTCNGRITVLPDGRELARCHPACGATGILEEAHEVSGGANMGPPALQGPRRTPLPAPAKGLPPPKK